MTTFDRSFWEGRWSQVLRGHANRVAHRPPNAHLTAEAMNLRPGLALDAGCGQGSDTLWLAARGWQVTAVDFSATALAHARSTAEAVGADVAERIAWVEGDLATWISQPSRYDLVACLYVHVGAHRGRGPSAGHCRHRCRCRDLRAKTLLRSAVPQRLGVPERDAARHGPRLVSAAKPPADELANVPVRGHEHFDCLSGAQAQLGRAKCIE